MSTEPAKVQVRRPRIFCQFGKKTFIEEKGGDTIGDIRLYRAFAAFADVYYNDHLIRWDGSMIGHPTDLCPPSRDYDLYYVRGNHDLFLQLPHPKVTLAYPYQADIFEAADAILVTTDAWRDLLADYNHSTAARAVLGQWYPEQVATAKNIINIQQTIDPSFLDDPAEQDVFNWKAKTTGGRVFGFFGRVTEGTIPHSLLEAVRLARATLGGVVDPVVAFSGSVRTTIPSDTLNLGAVEYGNVPALISACVATLGQECVDSSFLGSGKILDSMARTVPIVSRINPVRIEQLGSDYPGLFDTQDQANEIVFKLSTDAGYRSALSSYLKERREMFLPASTGQRIEAAFRAAGLF